MLSFVISRFKAYSVQAKNLSWYLAASLISAVIGIAFNPFLAKNLSSLDYSIIGYFSSFNGLFTPILNFSVITYYVKKYFQIPEDKRQEVCDTIIVTLFIWGSIASFLILAVFYAYFEFKNVEFPFAPYAFLLIVQLFGNNFALLYQVNCRMQRQAKRYFWVVIILALSTLFLSVVFVIIIKWGAFGRMFSGAVASLVIAVYSIKKVITKLRFSFSILKEAISFGWPISVASIIQYFIFGLGMVMVEPLGDTVMMGLFAIGSSFAHYLFIFYTSLSQTFEPDMYKGVAEYDYKKILRIILLIVFILTIIVLLFCLCAKQITHILTAGRYTEAYHFARIMSVGTVTTYLMSTMKMLLNAFDFSKGCLINQAIAAGLSIPFYIFMRDGFGYYGVAWANVITPMFVVIIGFIQFFILKPTINKRRYSQL